MGKVDSSADLWLFEREAREEGRKLIAGVDEVGRGPLAGPVVAGAVILPEGFDATGIRDSKLLSEAQRERAFDRIKAEAVAVGIGIIDSETIDEVNILQATYRAMKAALTDMGAAFDYVLVDGDKAIPSLGVGQTTIIEGDDKSVSIAAASIIAKVTRDCMMVEFASEFPGYGFENHKGYCTREHIEALAERGACGIHRKTFAPVSGKVVEDCPQRRLF